MVTESIETALIHLSNTQALNIQTISPYSSNWCIESLINTFGKMQNSYWSLVCACCSSVAKQCLILCDPMNCSTPGPPVLYYLKVWSDSFPISWWCHPIIHLLTPFLLLPSIFPTIRVFSNELAICIRWPEYWSFSVNISPSSEYSGWLPLGFDLLTV